MSLLINRNSTRRPTVDLQHRRSQVSNSHNVNEMRAIKVEESLHRNSHHDGTVEAEVDSNMEGGLLDAISSI
jgi:hypothetical protein